MIELPPTPTNPLEIPRPTSQKRFIILILGALFTVTPLSIDLYLPAFPQLAAALQCTTARVSLSLSSYFIGMAVGPLFYGPLLDRFGRKPPIYAGLTIYILTSLACLVAPTVGTIIALRFLQALGGCVAQVGAMAMVRDFFPVRESSKIFSLLMLILGVSPLLAPTMGGVIATALGWQWIFVLLAVMAAAVLLVTAAFLPEAQQPDRTVVLRPGPIIDTFRTVLCERGFLTYALAGAFSFSGLFVYVAASSIIFMEHFGVSARAFGFIFALLASGFIGSSQISILVSRYATSETIMLTAIACQVGIGLLFAIGTIAGWYGLISTVILLFGLLACLGFTNPNASALALAPFTRNVGSASAVLGFIQVGISALASAGVGILNIHTLAPITVMFTALALVGLIILLVGRRALARPPPPQPVS